MAVSFLMMKSKQKLPSQKSQAQFVLWISVQLARSDIGVCFSVNEISQFYYLCIIIN